MCDLCDRVLSEIGSSANISNGQGPIEQAMLFAATYALGLHRAEAHVIGGEEMLKSHEHEQG